jgi:hypothetical protein
MARSQQEIKALMDAAQAADSTLSTLNNPSQTAEFKLWKDLIAQEMNIHEQLWDVLEDSINESISKAAPATAAWIKDKVLKFQYSATNPQVLQLVDFAPNYPTVDETLRIVTRCAVVTLGNNTVRIKVLKSEPPTPLATAEFNSLNSYVANILPAGVAYQIVNAAADKLKIAADIYYNGQYTNIQDDVKNAINTYLKNLPPDGVVEVSELQNAINDTPGVNDVRVTEIRARQDVVPYASSTIVYSLTSGINLRVWNTFSASIVEETTSGQTFNDTLNFIVQA